jgi:Putative polyhydroxyalkanoic acid system protein (PHA_gran_rgn)
MRVAIAHSLDRAEVRKRLAARSHEIADFVPGPMARVRTDWPSDDVMTLNVAVMGQSIDGRIEIGTREVVFEIDLPPALSFVGPMIEGSIRRKGTELLE